MSEELSARDQLVIIGASVVKAHQKYDQWMKEDPRAVREFDRLIMDCQDFREFLPAFHAQFGDKFDRLELWFIWGVFKGEVWMTEPFKLLMEEFIQVRRKS